VRRLNFTTANPGVSADCHWATVAAQVHALKPSTIDFVCDPAARRFRGTTENVARLALDLATLKPDEPLHVELDGQKLE